MKRFGIVFFGLILCATNPTFAQTKQDAEQTAYYHQFPEAALRTADSLSRVADAKRDGALKVKATVMKATFTLTKDREAYPSVIKELEKQIATEKDVRVRSVLHSYAGELYAKNYRNDRWEIDRRAPITGEMPEDMRTWSGNIWKRKVEEHLKASIENSRALQETELQEYEAAFLKGEDSEQMEPTLYDFLCRRAIDLWGNEGTEKGIVVPEEAYRPASEFIRLDAEAFGGEEEKVWDVPGVFREWLAFRLREGNREALVAADSRRLDYVHRYYRGANRDSLYTQALERMMREYEDTPSVVELVAKRVSHLAYSGIKEKLEEALEMCEKGIRRFPDYKRIGILKEWVNKIRSEEVHAKFTEQVYPQENFECRIEYRNARHCTLQFYRLPDDTLVTGQLWVDIARPTRGLVREIRIDLPGELTARDTVIEVEGLPAGMYAVAIDSNQRAKMLLSSQLFGAVSEFEENVRFQVLDLNSGKPVRNAHVMLYREENKKYRLFYGAGGRDTVWYTPQKEERNLYYRITNLQNPTSYLRYLYFHHNPASEKERQSGMLLTDRPIYRPGQRVYFKGYRWMESDTLQAVQGEKLTVSISDYTMKSISSLQVTSNEFGSYTGSLVLPQNITNGNYIISCEGKERSFFKVEEYKRPSFEIQFAPETRTYYRGDSVRVKGVVKYFTGVPMGNTALSYRIGKSYFLRHVPSDNFAEGQVRTNAKGEFEIAFASTKDGRTWGCDVYRITVTATDSKGETQEKESVVQVYSGRANIVLTAPEKADKSRPVTFTVSLEDLPEGSRKTVSYTLAKLVRSDNPEEPHKDTLVERIIRQGDFSVAKKDSVTFNLQQEDSGSYLFTAECDGRSKKSIFYLYSTTDRTPPVATYKWLVTEKQNYKPGEKVRILFGSSLKDVHLQYDVIAHGKSVIHQTKHLSNSIVPIEFTYLKEYGNSVWVCIYYLKDKKWVKSKVFFNLDDTQPPLEMETAVFRDRLRPGEEEEWKIRIKPLRPGEKSEVLAMMYDASLDQLVNYHIYFRPMKINRQNYFSLQQTFSPWDNHTLSLYYGTPVYGVQKYPAFRLNQLNVFNLNHRLLAGDVAEFESIADYGDNDNVFFCKAIPDGFSTKTTADIISQESPVVLRKNFQETAFFYPQLQTDADGYVQLKFTVPDALTRWRFIAIASTRDMRTNILERSVVTSKPLMVRPNLPRFLRQGDRANIKVEVNNLSDSLQEGILTFELFTPLDKQVLFKQSVDFRMEAGKNALANFTFNVPAGVETLACRIVAKSEGFSDGEQHYLPILPNEILVNTTLPIFITSAGKHTFSLPQTEHPYRLTLELTANPVWFAVEALPHLQEPTHENATEIAAAYYVNSLAARIAQANPRITDAIRQWQQAENTPPVSPLKTSEELKSVLAETSPWSVEARTETERIQQLAELFDKNRLRYLQENAVTRLAELQTEAGGWSWFKGMGANRFMTMNVLVVLQRAALGGTPLGEKEKTMQVKALRYLDQAFQKDFKESPKRIDYMQVLYLYTRSLFRDIPLGDALEAHKYFMRLAQKQWAGASLYEKALLAITMHRYGFEKEAQDILESLRQYAVVSPEEGMYWPNNRSTYYRNSAIQEHTAILEAFKYIKGDSEHIDLMKQWLLRQKQVQNWGSVPSTVDAIHALLLSGEDLTVRREQPEVKIGQETIRPEDSKNPLGTIRASYEAPITRDMLNVEVQKHSDTPTWGGLFLQSFQPLAKISKHATDLSIDKKLYIEKANGQIETIAEHKEALKVGDKVIVRLTLTLKRDMEYLHVKDLRAACLEPTEQLSGNEWISGIPYYREMKDTGMNFFFERLPRGTYVLEYPLWVNQEGSYQDGIANFQCIYAPVYNAYSNAERIEVE